MNRTKIPISISDNILKGAGILYFFVVILGFIDLKLYYGKFGVPINEYISISEVLFFAMDKILIILLVLIFQIIGWLFFFRGVYDHQVKSINTNADLPSDWILFNQYLLSKESTIWFFTNLSLTVLAFFLRFIFSNNQTINLIYDFLGLNFWMYSCILFILVTPFQEFWFTDIKNGLKVKLITIIAVSFFVLILSLWVKNVFLYNRINKNRIRDKIEIYLTEGTSVASTDTLNYIGQTEKYYFFWNKITSETSIYSKGEVKKIVLHE